MIDTGASITILPQKMALGLHLNPTPVKLSAVNGRDMECFGKTVVVIGILGLRRSYTWTALAADTVNPLLGADFLRHYGLILDYSNGKLIDETIHQFIPEGRVTAQIQSITVNDHTNLPEKERQISEEK